MKNFPKSYEKFIDRFLKEIDKQYEIFVNVSGLYSVITELDYNIEEHCKEAKTKVYSFADFGVKGFRLGEDRHSDEMKVLSFRSYMRDFHPEQYENFKDTLERMKNGTPFFGELKPGQKFYFGGKLFIFRGSDKGAKSYVIQEVKQYNVIYLNGKTFRKQKVDALHKYFVKDSEIKISEEYKVTSYFDNAQQLIHWITDADSKLK